MKLDMIGLTVKSIEESVRFYRLLGLEIPDSDGTPHHEITLPNGLRLAFDDIEMIKGIYPDWKQAVGQRIGLAFLCDSVNDVDARFARLTAAGYTAHKQPWDAFWGQRYATVYDPDGSLVDLFHPIE